jgi:Ca2+-binding RTX toxin-like protein
MRPGTWGSLFILLCAALVLTLVLAPVGSARLIVGDRWNNKLVGTTKRDDLRGRDGADVLLGFGGWDLIYGQEGEDILLGQAGGDRLWGSGRDDTLDGGSGPDRLLPGWGTDVLDAGPGNDVIWAGENDADVDSIDCGAGFDRVVRNNGDRVFNCESVRPLRGRKPPGVVRAGTSADDALSNLRWTGTDFILGYAGDDYLNGHSDADVLWGNEGDDRLDGDHSPDMLLGGPGNDTLWGNSGNDRLWGGLGRDSLFGDWTVNQPDDGDDVILSIEADGEVDVIRCGSGNDRVVARPNDHVLEPGCERVVRISR